VAVAGASCTRWCPPPAPSVKHPSYGPAHLHPRPSTAPQEYLKRVAELEAVSSARDAARRSWDALRKRRLDEFMAGFGIITLRLKEMYQMITLGGDAELELVDRCARASGAAVGRRRRPQQGCATGGAMAPPFTTATLRLMFTHRPPSLSSPPLSLSRAAAWIPLRRASSSPCARPRSRGRTSPTFRVRAGHTATQGGRGRERATAGL
jgi:hypothetical protein